MQMWVRARAQVWVGSHASRGNEGLEGAMKRWRSTQTDLRAELPSLVAASS